jgi:hypothetical protein
MRTRRRRRKRHKRRSRVDRGARTPGRRAPVAPTGDAARWRPTRRSTRSQKSRRGGSRSAQPALAGRRCAATASLKKATPAATAKTTAAMVPASSARRKRIDPGPVAIVSILRREASDLSVRLHVPPAPARPAVSLLTELCRSSCRKEATWTLQELVCSRSSPSAARSAARSPAAAPSGPTRDRELPAEPCRQRPAPPIGSASCNMWVAPSAHPMDGQFFS